MEQARFSIHIFKEKATELTKRGYRRISNKYGLLSRIDRPDWKHEVAKRFCPYNFKQGLKRVESYDVSSMEDFYRRNCSEDKIEVMHEIARLVPNSSNEETGFIENIEK